MLLLTRAQIPACRCNRIGQTRVQGFRCLGRVGILQDWYDSGLQLTLGLQMRFGVYGLGFGFFLTLGPIFKLCLNVIIFRLLCLQVMAIEGSSNHHDGSTRSSTHGNKKS